MIKSNDLKKGDLVQLNNGWYAVIADNLKGNTRMATVYGHTTEMGSVYAHDIKHRLTLSKEGESPVKGAKYLLHTGGSRGAAKPGMYLIEEVEPTEAQKKLRRQLECGGW